MTLHVGNQAPQFILYNTEKKQISLNDYKGKTLIILFFPFAFTGVCTEELCNINNEFSYYTKMGAEILGISVDSPFTLAKFREELDLTFELLSDFNKEVCQMYSSYYDEFVFNLKGVAKRSVFVVDAQGIIRYIEIKDDAGELPNFQAIQKIISELHS